MRAVWIGVFVLVGCGGGAKDEAEGPRSATWLEGFSYQWDFFNHRISYLDLLVDGAEADVAVIGGTSTTNVAPVYEDGCSEEGCWELPFIDKAEVGLAWGEVTTETANFAETSIELLATADGDSQVVTIELDEPPRGDPVAILRGLQIDTNHPLAGDPSCYRPEYGWVPTKIELAIEAVKLVDGDEAVEIEVSAAFAAGLTLEEERVCLDESTPRAVVPMTAHVLVVFAPGTPESWTVHQEAAWALGDPVAPDPQEPPALEDRDLRMDEPIVGWTSLAWAFHVDDPTGRGAYIRSLQFMTGEDGRTGGSATNFSPPTQLSGFDFVFDGAVTAIEVGGDVMRHRYDGLLDVALGDDGVPVVHTVAPTGG